MTVINCRDYCQHSDDDGVCQLDEIEFDWRGWTSGRGWDCLQYAPEPGFEEADR